MQVCIQRWVATVVVFALGILVLSIAVRASSSTLGTEQQTVRIRVAMDWEGTTILRPFSITHPQTITIHGSIRAHGHMTGSNRSYVRILGPDGKEVWRQAGRAQVTDNIEHSIEIGNDRLGIWLLEGYAEAASRYTFVDITVQFAVFVGRGSLVVTSSPDGARVVIDDKVVGITPYVQAHMAPGTYRISLSAENYAPWTQVIRVRPQELEWIRVTLNPKEGRLGIIVQDGEAPLGNEGLFVSAYRMKGVYVAGVLTDGAASGRLRTGDLILAVNGHRVENSNRLLQLLKQYRAGAVLYLLILRDRYPHQVVVILQEV